MRNNNCKNYPSNNELHAQQLPSLGRADSLTNLYISEIHENDRLIEVNETVTGLQMASMLIARTISSNSDLGYHHDVIKAMESIVSALAYITVMNDTVCAGREMFNLENGGAAC